MISSNGRFLVFGIVAFTVMTGLGLVDLSSDLEEGASLAHVATEGSIALLALVCAALIARNLVSISRNARAHSLKLAERLADTERAAAKWRAEAEQHLRGLGEALHHQFERWSLTAAEKEVALLLLKGLSHKEIADVRAITEATARQQARTIYKKAGLTGRHDLSAFFLEDLLLPQS